MACLGEEGWISEKTGSIAKTRKKREWNPGFLFVLGLTFVRYVQKIFPTSLREVRRSFRECLTFTLLNTEHDMRPHKWAKFVTSRRCFYSPSPLAGEGDRGEGYHSAAAAAH